MATGEANPDRLLGRDFLLLWQGQLVSQLGNQAFYVATTSWALSAMGSAGLIGLLLMAATLPAVVVGPFAGAVADRHSRRGLIVAADLLRGLGHLLVGGLMFLFPDATGIIIPCLLVQALLSGILGSLLTPTLAASLPDLVPASKLAAANSLHHLSLQATALVGQAAGGLAYAWLGAARLVLFDGLTFLASAGCARLARIPDPRPAAAKGMRMSPRAYARDVLDGVVWLWRQPFLRALALLFAAVNFLFSPILVLLPVFVRDRLRAGPEWYGFLLAGAGAGAMAGAALAPSLAARSGVLRSALTLIGLGTAALALCRAGVLGLGILFLIGLCSAVVNVSVITALQESTPPALRGRALAVTIAVAGAATPFGLALGGLMGSVAESALPWVMAVCGAGILACAPFAPDRRRASDPT